MNENNKGKKPEKGREASMPKKAKDFAIKDHYDFTELVEIFSFINSEEGCPWRRAQNHASIRNACVEEAFETCEAIDKHDSAALCDELGDLLVQVIIHAEIAERNGEFSLRDVIDNLARKQIRRNAHVFNWEGEEKPGIEDALNSWSKIKENSKRIATVTERLRDVPESPALHRAYKLNSRLRKSSLTPADLFASNSGLGEDPKDRYLAEITQNTRNFIAAGNILAAAARYEQAGQEAFCEKAPSEKDASAAKLPGNPPSETEEEPPARSHSSRNLTDACDLANGIRDFLHDYSLDETGLKAKQEEFMGDALLAMASLAASAGINPEYALKGAIDRKIRMVSEAEKANPKAFQKLKNEAGEGQKNKCDKASKAAKEVQEALSKSMKNIAKEAEDDHAFFLPETAVQNLSLLKDLGDYEIR